MNRFKKIVFALILVVSFGGAAWAAGDLTQEPKVEYSADVYTDMEGMTTQGKIYRTPGKERKEMDMGGMKSIMITRRDKGVSWTLMPVQKMYMEHKLEDSKEQKEEGTKIETSIVGEEVVNGVVAKKNKVIITDKEGNKFGSFMWVTKEGIQVKTDTLVKMEDGKKVRMKTELKNLKVEKQDPKLFEIPEGYRNMSLGMPGMGGGFNMDEMMKGRKKTR